MNVGDWVILTTDIWEDECDGLIPGHYLGYKSDRVQIKELLPEGHDFQYSVAHEGVDGSFQVKSSEIKSEVEPK